MAEDDADAEWAEKEGYGGRYVNAEMRDRYVVVLFRHGRPFTSFGPMTRSEAQNFRARTMRHWNKTYSGWEDHGYVAKCLNCWEKLEERE